MSSIVLCDKTLEESGTTRSHQHQKKLAASMADMKLEDRLPQFSPRRKIPATVLLKNFDSVPGLSSLPLDDEEAPEAPEQHGNNVGVDPNVDATANTEAEDKDGKDKEKNALLDQLGEVEAILGCSMGFEQDETWKEFCDDLPLE